MTFRCARYANRGTGSLTFVVQWSGSHDLPKSTKIGGWRRQPHVTGSTPRIMTRLSWIQTSPNISTVATICGMDRVDEARDRNSGAPHAASDRSPLPHIPKKECYFRKLQFTGIIGQEGGGGGWDCVSAECVYQLAKYRSNCHCTGGDLAHGSEPRAPNSRFVE